MVKNYVLDYSTMIYDPNSIFCFSDNNVILIASEIARLERASSEDRKDSVRYNASEALKLIKQALNQKNTYSDGVEIISSDGKTAKLYIVSASEFEMTSRGINVQEILKALEYMKEKNGQPTILVSRILSLKVKVKENGFEAQDYMPEKIVSNDNIKGIIELSAHSYPEFEPIFSSDDVREIKCPTELKILPNQYLLLKDGYNREAAVLRYDGREHILKVCKGLRKHVFGLQPKDTPQALALDLLMDPNIPLVSLAGMAGCGKTILAIAAAFAQTMPNINNRPKYDKIIFVRPMVAAGEEMGFIPGDESDKIRPWMGSLYDSIEKLIKLDEKENRFCRCKKSKDDASIDEMVETFIAEQVKTRRLQLCVPTFMRGRTFNDAFIIVDEAQGISPHVMKMIMTRVGENSKLVITGDPSDNQLDNELTDTYFNGLVYAITNMLGSNYAGLIKFTEAEVHRSDLVHEICARLCCGL